MVCVGGIEAGVLGGRRKKLATALYACCRLVMNFSSTLSGNAGNKSARDTVPSCR